MKTSSGIKQDLKKDNEQKSLTSTEVMYDEKGFVSLAKLAVALSPEIDTSGMVVEKEQKMEEESGKKKNEEKIKPAQLRANPHESQQNFSKDSFYFQFIQAVTDRMAESAGGEMLRSLVIAFQTTEVPDLPKKMLETTVKLGNANDSKNEHLVNSTSNYLSTVAVAIANVELAKLVKQENAQRATELLQSAEQLFSSISLPLKYPDEFLINSYKIICWEELLGIFQSPSSMPLNEAKSELQPLTMKNQNQKLQELSVAYISGATPTGIPDFAKAQGFFNRIPSQHQSSHLKAIFNQPALPLPGVLPCDEKGEPSFEGIIHSIRSWQPLITEERFSSSSSSSSSSTSVIDSIVLSRPATYYHQHYKSKLDIESFFGLFTVEFFQLLQLPNPDNLLSSKLVDLASAFANYNVSHPEQFTKALENIIPETDRPARSESKENKAIKKPQKESPSYIDELAIAITYYYLGISYRESPTPSHLHYLQQANSLLAEIVKKEKPRDDELLVDWLGQKCHDALMDILRAQSNNNVLKSKETELLIEKLTNQLKVGLFARLQKVNQMNLFSRSTILSRLAPFPNFNANEDKQEWLPFNYENPLDYAALLMKPQAEDSRYHLAIVLISLVLDWQEFHISSTHMLWLVTKVQWLLYRHGAENNFLFEDEIHSQPWENSLQYLRQKIVDRLVNTKEEAWVFRATPRLNQIKSQSHTESEKSSNEISNIERQLLIRIIEQQLMFFPEYLYENATDLLNREEYHKCLERLRAQGVDQELTVVNFNTAYGLLSQLENTTSGERHNSARNSLNSLLKETSGMDPLAVAIIRFRMVSFYRTSPKMKRDKQELDLIMTQSAKAGYWPAILLIVFDVDNNSLTDSYDSKLRRLLWSLNLALDKEEALFFINNKIAFEDSFDESCTIALRKWLQEDVIQPGVDFSRALYRHLSSIEEKGEEKNKHFERLRKVLLLDWNSHELQPINNIFSGKREEKESSALQRFMPAMPAASLQASRLQNGRYLLDTHGNISLIELVQIILDLQEKSAEFIESKWENTVTPVSNSQRLEQYIASLDNNSIYHQLILSIVRDTGISPNLSLLIQALKKYQNKINFVNALKNISGNYNAGLSVLVSGIANYYLAAIAIAEGNIALARDFLFQSVDRFDADSVRSHQDTLINSFRITVLEMLKECLLLQRLQLAPDFVHRLSNIIRRLIDVYASGDTLSGEVNAKEALLNFQKLIENKDDREDQETLNGLNSFIRYCMVPKALSQNNLNSSDQINTENKAPNNNNNSSYSFTEPKADLSKEAFSNIRSLREMLILEECRRSSIEKQKSSRDSSDSKEDTIVDVSSASSLVKNMFQLYLRQFEKGSFYWEFQAAMLDPRYKGEFFFGQLVAAFQNLMTPEDYSHALQAVMLGTEPLPNSSSSNQPALYGRDEQQQHEEDLLAAIDELDGDSEDQDIVKEYKHTAPEEKGSDKVKRLRVIANLFSRFHLAAFELTTKRPLSKEVMETLVWNLEGLLQAFFDAQPLSQPYSIDRQVLHELVMLIYRPLVQLQQAASSFEGLPKKINTLIDRILFYRWWVNPQCQDSLIYYLVHLPNPPVLVREEKNLSSIPAWKETAEDYAPFASLYSKQLRIRPTEPAPYRWELIAIQLSLLESDLNIPYIQRLQRLEKIQDSLARLELSIDGSNKDDFDRLFDYYNNQLTYLTADPSQRMLKEEKGENLSIALSLCSRIREQHIAYFRSRLPHPEMQMDVLIKLTTQELKSSPNNQLLQQKNYVYHFFRTINAVTKNEEKVNGDKLLQFSNTISSRPIAIQAFCYYELHLLYLLFPKLQSKKSIGPSPLMMAARLGYTPAIIEMVKNYLSKREFLPALLWRLSLATHAAEALGMIELAYHHDKNIPKGVYDCLKPLFSAAGNKPFVNAISLIWEAVKPLEGELKEVKSKRERTSIYQTILRQWGDSFEQFNAVISLSEYATTGTTGGTPDPLERQQTTSDFSGSGTPTSISSTLPSAPPVAGSTLPLPLPPTPPVPAASSFQNEGSSSLNNSNNNEVGKTINLKQKLPELMKIQFAFPSSSSSSSLSPESRELPSSQNSSRAPIPSFDESSSVSDVPSGPETQPSPPGG